ncbi:MAG: YiiD C-terminal domain-containing protein [Pseudomonadales bacterium]
MKPALYIDSPATLEETLHQLIPLSREMGVQVLDYDGKRLSLTAPLAPNINHQQSAFGGSLYAVAALAGWGLMQLKLTELKLDCNTVIADAAVSYLKPVLDDIVCCVSLPPDADAFFAELAARGQASTKVRAAIGTEDDPAMTLTGTYHLRQNK